MILSEYRFSLFGITRYQAALTLRKPFHIAVAAPDMGELDTGITSNRRAQSVSSAVYAKKPLGKRYCTAVDASL